MKRMVYVIAAFLLAAPVFAKGPEGSPRPVARGEPTDQGVLTSSGPNLSLIRPKARLASQVAKAPPPAGHIETVSRGAISPLSVMAPDMTATIDPGLRPLARPAELQRQLETALAQELRTAGIPGFIPERAAAHIIRTRAFAARSPQAISESLRPFLRPKAMVEKVMAKRREAKRGSICGDIDLQGTSIGFVPGRIKACGVNNAVKVRSVSGVTLSQQAVMDCTTAKALKRWVTRGLKPAVGSLGGGAADIKVAAHYACRTRNNQPGGKISEHGKGRAIDIAAIRLRDGSEISVLRDWGGGAKGRALRKMHSAACGPFGTVLGPNANKFHRDHFHFDTARYRSGTYCR